MPLPSVENKNTDEEKQKKKRFLWLLLIFLLLAALAGSTFFYLNNSKNISKSQVVAGDFLPDKKDAKNMTGADLEKYAQKAVDASKFQLEINPSSKINYADQNGYIGIKNPKTNVYPINVTFFTKENKKIYSSGAIEPGQEITSGSLSQKLERGKYDIKARFDIYDDKTHEKRGQQFAVVNMIVK